jgi:hypothetical protein
VAARRITTPENVTVLTDAQAAIKRMASEEPGPGQMYAIQARRHIATLRRPRPDIIEIRWCPAHKGVQGNEKADEWAKLAAEEPDAHGVEWLQGGARPMPLPRSLAHLKREITEKKWAEARRWAGGRVTSKKYKMPREQLPDKTGWEYQEARLEVLPAEDRALPHGAVPYPDKDRAAPECWWCRYKTQTREHVFKNCPEWKEQQKGLWAEVWKETGRGKSRFKIRDLLVDGRCSQAVLDFLTSTDVGRLVPTPGAEEDAQSEASEWERRERREKEEERRVEAEELSAEVEELPLFLPTPAFMATAEEEWGGEEISFALSLVTLFSAPFFGFIPFVLSLSLSIFLGQAWAEGKGKLATCRLARTAAGK